MLHVASADVPSAAPTAAAPVPEPQPPPQEPRPAPARRTGETTTAQAELAEDLLKARASWDEQQREFDRARQANQVQERAEGYAWAERSEVRAHADCQAVGQRTAAFIAGCFDYLRVAAEAGAPRRADRS